MAGASVRRAVLRGQVTVVNLEVMQIAFMLVPLGADYSPLPPCVSAMHNARDRRRGVAKRAYRLVQQRFTCRWFDAEAGDCAIYSARPAMCRDYPYGAACEQPACTMNGVHDGPA